MTRTAATVKLYQQLTEDLARWTVESVRHVYRRGAPRYPTWAVSGAIASVINAGNAAARTLATLFTRGVVERQVKAPVPTPELTPVDDTDRLTKAVETILTARLPADEPDDVTEARLDRLARSEVFDAGQQAVEDVIEQMPVVGWRRVLDADPCDRCARWAEDGRIFPKGTHFKRHFGCNCQAEIITATMEKEGKKSA